MEVNAVELYDYLAVIWKRKILIIVMTLVGIGVGVGVMKLKPELPVTYQATTIVKIGQKVSFTSDGISPNVDYIDKLDNLVNTIPFRYGYNVKEASGYHLEVQQTGVLPLLKLILQGPDRGVEGALKEIVDMLIDDHYHRTKTYFDSLTGFMKGLEEDVKMFQKNIAVTKASIKEIRRRGGVQLENMVPSVAVRQEEKSHTGQTAFLNMLYLKTIDLQKDLREDRKSLRNTQWQQIKYKTAVFERDKYYTEKISKIMVTTSVKQKIRPGSTILVTGVASLLISLFIIFFMEYIEESKSKRKLQG